MISKTRKNKQYKITIEEVDVVEPRTLEFFFQDNEDLFNIVDNLKKGINLEPETATKIGVGLRLLGPVMMKNRKHSLFVDFMPHFKHFMQKLKASIKQENTKN
ncbi:DUF3861 domain-containing protein [Vibrio sagamiensis]|nr:DUF3861 domain-containing protein [Vibrio sagamiensis]PNQ53563.1 DUF3861 domain-containing protein [Vibrio agarivorans]